MGGEWAMVTLQMLSISKRRVISLGSVMWILPLPLLFCIWMICYRINVQKLTVMTQEHVNDLTVTQTLFSPSSVSLNASNQICETLLSTSPLLFPSGHSGTFPRIVYSVQIGFIVIVAPNLPVESLTYPNRNRDPYLLVHSCPHSSLVVLICFFCVFSPCFSSCFAVISRALLPLQTFVFFNWFVSTLFLIVFSLLDRLLTRRWSAHHYLPVWSAILFWFMIYDLWSSFFILCWYCWYISLICYDDPFSVFYVYSGSFLLLIICMSVIYYITHIKHHRT